MNVKLRVREKNIEVPPDVYASTCLEVLFELRINAKSKYMHLC